MSAQHYAFRVGTVNCAVLLDKLAILGVERFMGRFPDHSEADYRQAYSDMGLDFDQADDAFNILLIQIEKDLILVDTGQGGRPVGGHLPESLKLAGFSPDEITKIIITHAHGDHVMGLLDDNGAPVFKNASYIISNEELTFWQNRIDAGLTDQQAIVDMIRAQGLRLIAMNEEILPGLTAIPLPGHTPGQIGLKLTSNGETLYHLADALHSPMQFAHPEWSARFDLDTEISVPTRRSALGQSADEQALALFYHLTFPGLGRVKRAESGFIWKPIG